MWTVLRFLNLFVLLVIVISGSDAAADYTYVDIENDAIIIEAAPLDAEPTSREKRNLEAARQTWAEALGEGSPCLTSRGILGSCTTFRHCYPYIKLPNIGVWESWVLGNHDTCGFFNTEGVQTTGVCCTNPVSLEPDEEDAAAAGENDVGQEVGSSSNLQDTKYQNVPWPPPVPTHPTNPTNKPVVIQWPPPVPTHPPNHHYPTHPPTQNYPVPSQSTTKKPTYPPWSTTKKPGYPPQRPPQMTPPPWQQTTKRPSSTPWPGGAWPPQAPTHPTSTTHKPPSGVETPFQPGCGAKNGNLDQERIVGGQNSIPNEWPWMAALFNGDRQFCGGSLIDNIHILSAAHCVAHMSSWDVARIKVNLADHNIKVTNEVAHVQRKVKRIIRHKGFEFRTLYSDIAILTMDRPVEFTKTVSPICLPSVTTKAYNGKVGTVAGWGSLRENGPQPSILQKVSVPIWSNQQCASKYGNAAPGGITSAMICAGTADKDSCSGDSGGPLMVNEGRWEQVGIVSWGIGCGKGQYPGVYTRVTSFMAWIKKNIQMNLLR